MSDGTDAIFANLATTEAALWTAMLAHILPELDDHTLMHATILEDVRTIPYGGLEVDHTPVAGTGVVGGPGIPTDSCLAIKRQTATHGRSGRGRLYWPIWSASWLVTPDAVTPSAAAGIVTGIAGFQTAVEAALNPAKVVVLSTVNGNAPRAAGVTFPITSWSTADNHVDSQRRRLLGRGP